MFDIAWVVPILFCAQLVLIGFIGYLLKSPSKQPQHAETDCSQSAPEPELCSVEQQVESENPDNHHPTLVDDVSDLAEVPTSASKNTSVVQAVAEWRPLTPSPAKQHLSEGLKPYDRTRKASPDELKSDQRKFRRCPYEKVQFIAPYDGDELPVSGDFQEVMCHDISAQGIAFYSEAVPKFQRAVVALTTGEAGEQYMVSQIVRTNAVEHDGRKMTLVGCRFMSRLPNETYSDGLRSNQIGSSR